MDIKEMESLTKRNNKDIIFDALQEALGMIKAKGEGVLDPVKEMAIKAANDVVNTAEKAMKDESLTEMIHKLRTGGTVTLEEIAEKIASAKADYDNIVNAKSIKADELKEMFGIEKELLDLAVVVNTNEVLKDKYADELNATQEEKYQLILDKNAEAKQIIEDAKLEAKAIKDQAEADKKKDKAEWDYDLSRQKIKDKDELKDELAEERKKFEAACAETKAEHEDREKVISAREDAMTDKEEEFAKLKESVDGIPKAISIAVDKAVKKAVEDAEAKAETVAEYKEKEYEAEKKALDREIEMLKESNKDKDAKIKDLTDKLDGAYAKIQDVANNVAGSNRPVYNSGSSDSKTSK